ncbi:MAG: type I restriction endonuclease subunit R [Candidatus Viridilinea halotolerans]|uniref:Type I restriction endonuclease subunit R n=1 Tax=Candidatus Viridilinea halotolerans TaxID=2491704 RepID=A0A426TSN0_9CHLR|nr:MAG: type I restriction endonuclease subunit R [Candidatus Viridilinea halotolerans]
MTKHHERTFEDEVVAHLTAHGWLEGQSGGYDRELALYPEDVLGWLAATQPTELAKLGSLHNGDSGKVVLKRLAEVLDKDGALAVLRRGFKQVSARFAMCQFKPAQGLNPTTLTRYDQVRCRVVRQLRYSLNAANDALDLVFFVNGIPVATAELKTDFTQSVRDAMAQYRHDRPPRDPATNRDEPLLQFKRRALVHFAVSSDEVWMTTRLAGKATHFLPFNLGNDGGAGNPPNEQGYRSAYLWERVLERTSLLDILANFVHLEQTPGEDARGRKIINEALIFPRYHQLDAVRALITAARAEGPGQCYLIQHSAGSGKSNSIAWLAHRLASLHDATDTKCFDSVIVVTDRTVLDAQLQETIYQFEHKTGVVKKIEATGGVKSEQLASALLERTPIIIVTLQTFPFALEAIRTQGTLRTRRFAVLADEAHSSQTGSAASALSKVLTAEQREEGEAISIEDLLLAAMEDRAVHPNISFFAFTATPKAKTLLRFGRRPNPTAPPSEANMPQAFHVYTMQQAIEEGYILDVLTNYTPYRLAFRLAHHGQEYDQAEVDQAQAMKGLMRWVRLHPYNISQKVQIIVEHFRENVQRLMKGHAKAMVVTGSRKEAVRYKLALDAYLTQQGYSDLAALVAFSGEVNDPESGPGAFSEHTMNPGLKGRDIRAAFKSDEYQVLIVANKFQTGFDQPLLCAMYVDKRLDGITAVQTLSRLNRTAAGKTTIYVLDFVNDPAQILAAFQPYYKRAELASVTDPNLIHTLQTKLDDAQIYNASEIESFVKVYLDPQGKQAGMQAALAPAVERFRVRWRAAQETRDKKRLDELELFRKDLASFVRLYDFLAQIINYGDTDLEKRSIFFRLLLPLLATERLSEAIDLSGVELTHYRLKDQGTRGLNLKEAKGDFGLVPPGDVGSGESRDPLRAKLAAIIQRMNDLFEGELSEADMIGLATHISERMIANPVLVEQAQHNTKEQFALGDFPKVMMEEVIGGMDSYQSMISQVLGNERVREGFAAVLLDIVYAALKERQESRA